mmetsp:Transcript_48251/g.108687  ORF Transcript_48251/g.108687 Transcript_48251/m.108687 type:complete len:214 (-) Transcript_48251:392-1033(-)
MTVWQPLSSAPSASYAWLMRIACAGAPPRCAAVGSPRVECPPRQLPYSSVRAGLMASGASSAPAGYPRRRFVLSSLSASASRAAAARTQPQAQRSCCHWSATRSRLPSAAVPPRTSRVICASLRVPCPALTQETSKATAWRLSRCPIATLAAMTRQPPPHRHWIDSDCQWLTPHGMRMSMLSDRRATQHAAHTRRNPQPRREGHGKIQQVGST